MKQNKVNIVNNKETPLKKYREKERLKIVFNISWNYNARNTASLLVKKFLLYTWWLLLIDSTSDQLLCVELFKGTCTQ